MYNSKLINQVREGKAAIEWDESPIEYRLLRDLCQEIWPKVDYYPEGGFKYYFKDDENDINWYCDDELPEGMIAIPFADFLKEESSVSEFPNNSPDLEAERRRFWCDIVPRCLANPDFHFDGIMDTAEEALAAFDERFGVNKKE